jgi:hypothetical protein
LSSTGDCSMSEEEKLTARERRKLLRQFSELGRRTVATVRHVLVA